jgi:predicted permease
MLAPDVRLALRSLAQHRGFAITVIATLGLGVAAITLVFSYIYGSLLRPPPFREPDRLVLIYRTAVEAGRGAPALFRWSYPRLQRLRRTAQSFEGVTAFGRSDWNLGGGEAEPERVAGEAVSASYFSVVGIQPTLGRSFTAEEDSTPGTHPVAVIGHGLWVRRFGAEPAVLGKTIRVNGEPLVVIGVMPRGFDGVTGRADLWIPQMMAPLVSYAGTLTSPENFISVLGRLRPGVGLDQALAELGVVGRRIAAELPDQDDVPTVWGATAVPLSAARVDPGNRRSVLLLFAAVGFLLVLACANVAGLGVSRAVARRQEIVVRLALGAGKGRLVRQLLTESAVLGVVGGGLGAVVALFVSRVVQPPRSIPGPGNMYGAVGDFARVEVDLAVLGFSVLVSVVAILLSGLAPALHAGRTDLAAELKERSATGSSAGRGARLQAGLVVVEIALALVLSIGAGLFFASLGRLQEVPLGVDPGNVLTFRIMPSDVRYGPAGAPALLDRVIEAVSGVPGVEAVTVDACAPAGVGCANSTLRVIGRPDPPPGQAPFVMRHYVAPAHFQTLGIPLKRGRPFTFEDRPGRARVVIINEQAARQFWPGEDPIGHRVWFGGGSSFNHPDSAGEIVGIVGDVPYGSLERGTLPSFYTPYRQFTYPFRTVMVKAAGNPLGLVPEIRRAVRGVDDLPIFEVRLLEDQLGDSWARTRFTAMLIGGFALLALLLAAGGIYGIISHSVGQRRRELGIRVALGAAPIDLIRLVVGLGAGLAGIGVAIGIGAAYLLTRAVRAMLFGVDPADPVVYLAQALLLMAVAVLASYLPARRASRMDPVATLRAE